MLIDHYLRDFQFSEYHEIEIASEPDTIFPAVKRVDFRNSKIIDLLFRIRGLPRTMRTLDDFLEFGFILLEEKKNDELVIGFFLEKGKLENVEPGRFIALAGRAPAAGAWNFKIGERGGNLLLSTETRVHCNGLLPKILFSTYWFVVSPFSGMIRMAMLKMIRAEAERSSDISPSDR